MLQMLSKTSHDKPSCFQSGRIVGAFDSTPVARRQVTTIHIIHPGVESTKGVAMDGTPVKCSWEDVAV